MRCCPWNDFHIGLVGFIQSQTLDSGDEVSFFFATELDLDPGFFHGFQEFCAEIFQFFVIGEFKVNYVDFFFQCGRQVIVGREQEKEFFVVLEMQVAFTDLAYEAGGVAQPGVQVLEDKERRFIGGKGKIQCRCRLFAVRDHGIAAAEAVVALPGIDVQAFQGLLAKFFQKAFDPFFFKRNDLHDRLPGEQ